MGTRTSTLGSQNPPNRNISSPREGQRREFGANGKDTKLFESRESGANKVLHSVTKIHSCPHIVAFGGSNKRVTVLNWDKRETLVSLTGPDKAITQVTGAHGPHCVFASSRDYNVYGWNINSDRPQEVLSDANCVFRGHTLSVSSVTGSPDHCEFLCSGGRDTNVKLWDTSTQQCIRDKAISRNIVTQLQWLGSEMSIVQCSEDRSVKIWDVRTLEVVQVFSGRNILTCCDVSCDGNYIVTGERGSRAGVVVWDRRSGKGVTELLGHLSTVSCTKFFPSSPPNNIASCSEDGFVKVWDADFSTHSSKDGAPAISHCVPASGGLTCMELLPDHMVACTSLEAGLSIWKLNSSGQNMSLVIQY